MRVAVLGAGGHMGHRVATDLADSGVSVVAADRSLEAVAELDGRETVTAVALDVTDPAAPDRLENLDLDGLVGAVGPFYRFGTTTLELAIEAGLPYVDICDDHDAVVDQLDRGVAAEDAVVPAVVGCGWTPGISNLLAARAVDEVADPHTVAIDWVGSAADAEGLAVLKHVLHVTAGEVPQHVDGQRQLVPAGSDPFQLHVPEIGQVTTRACGHPEPVTLPRSLPVETVRLRGGLVDEWQNQLLGALAGLGPHSESRIDRIARPVHAIERFLPGTGVERSGVVVSVRGASERRTYAAVGTMAALTGCTASVGIQQLVDQPVEPGVHAPEAVLSTGSVLEALAERLIRFYRWQSGPEEQWVMLDGGP